MLIRRKGLTKRITTNVFQIHAYWALYIFSPQALANIDSLISYGRIKGDRRMLARTVFRVLEGSPNETVTALGALDLIRLLIHCFQDNIDTTPVFATLMDFAVIHFRITLSSENLVKRS